MRTLLGVLVVGLLLCSQAAQPKYTKRFGLGPRLANWSALLTQPSAFVSRSLSRLRKRPGGYSPSAACVKYVGLTYLDHIRRSRVSLCSATAGRGTPKAPNSGGSGGSSRGGGVGRRLHGASGPQCGGASECGSSVDCYTAPFVTVGNSSKATVSLCRSHNLLLDSCAFLSGRRPGTLSKKFPLPARGAVRLACQPANISQLASGSSGKLGWLRSIHTDVWWGNATRDDAAVAAACAPGSPSLVTTPTLFVMRDRHANYAHEMEAVSMAFSFLAALEPQDVAEQGVQVVIVDQAPPTGFLETWARISAPHRLRLLAQEPFPPGTCFASAYHVYTFAAGVGYNTNPATSRCESPVVTGLSHWLRQLYEQGDPSARVLQASPAAAAATVAGPAAVAAGVHGLRPAAGGIVMRNVVWLSRRNLEMLRLLLNASAGWKAMRLVRNEEAVVGGLVDAVQEWNAESCMLRRFNRAVKAEFERSLTHIHPVHAGAVDPASVGAAKAATPSASASASAPDPSSAVSTAAGAAAADTVAATAAGRRRSLQQRSRLQLHGTAVSHQRELQGTAAAAPAASASVNGGGEIDEHMDDLALDHDDAADDGGLAAAGLDDAAPGTSTAGGGGNRTADTRPPYMIGNNVIALDKMWELDAAADAGCRRTNVLFRFVEGDFSDLSYADQLHTVFHTGVLAGVHGAGLAHGFFLPPGQSAVLQVLGDSFAKVAACNVFRNMAVGAGNLYEDVLYKGVDVDVAKLKQAAKRAMDFVARRAMEAQLRRSGPLRLSLADQSHFSVVVPPQEQCPVAAAAETVGP